MTAEEREAALALLRAPDLLDRILADFDGVRRGRRGDQQAGGLPRGGLAETGGAARGAGAVVIGGGQIEPDGCGAGVRSGGGAGALLGDDRPGLFYMGRGDLKHTDPGDRPRRKVPRRAAYALKLLQSDGELTIASTGKDPETGTLMTQEYRVDGPVMIFLTTTAIDIDEELLNRCLVLSVDEGREQTRGNPSTAAPAPHPGRLAGARGESRNPDAESERATVVAPARRGEPLCRPADLPVGPHAHPPRPREIPYPDRRDRVAAPASTAGAAGRWQRLRLCRGRLWPISR